MKWILVLVLFVQVFADAETHLQPGMLNRSESVCNDNDCLTYGWSSYAYGWRSDTWCDRGLCEINGWSSRGSNGGWSEVSCVGSGCFIDGWYEQSNGWNFRIDCNRGDCMTYGWTVTGLNNNFYAGVRCIDNDCAHVGSIYRSPQNYTESLCKNDSCWEYGWMSR